MTICAAFKLHLLFIDYTNFRDQATMARFLETQFGCLTELQFLSLTPRDVNGVLDQNSLEVIFRMLKLKELCIGSLIRSLMTVSRND